MALDLNNLLQKLRPAAIKGKRPALNLALLRERLATLRLPPALIDRVEKSPLGPLLDKLGIRLSSRKFVIVVGDEGTLMVKVGPAEIEDAWFAPADIQSAVEEFREHLAGDTNAPVILMADVLEQSFRDEKLPKANILDKAKLLQRRLEMAFPNDSLRAALPLKHRKGDEDKSPRYMFAALPSTAVVEKWRTMVESLPNPLYGLGMLPLESVDLIRHLVPSEHAGVDAKHWRTMISLEVTGGFRLIIERNDQLVVTRLPIKPAEEDGPAEVAELIEREFHSTIGYVKRMGYLEKDHMDVVILTSEDVRDQLLAREIRASTVTILTPEEAGQRIGVARTGQPGMPFGDMVHAAWVARKRHPRLQLRSPLIAQRQQMALTTRSSLLAAAAASFAMLVYAGVTFSDLSAAEEARDEAQQRVNLAQRDLDRVMAELAVFEVSPLDMRTVLQADKKVKAMQEDMLPPLALLAKALGPVRATSIFIEGHTGEDKGADRNTPRRPAANQPQTAQAQKGFQFRFTADFQNAADADAAVQAANDLLARLRDQLPGRKIEIARMPVNVLPQQILAGGLGGTKETAATTEKTRFTADYLIGKEGG